MDIICIWPPVVMNLQSFSVVRLQISLDSGRGHQEVHVCAEVSQQSLGQGRTKGPRVLDWLCLAAQRYWWIVLQALLFVALVMSLLCKGVSHCYVLVATAGWCGRFQALASWGWILRSGGFHVHDPRGYGGISIQNLETLSMFSLVKRSNQMAVCGCIKTESDLVVIYSHQGLVSHVMQARITKQKEEEKKAQAKAEEALKLRGPGWASYSIYSIACYFFKNIGLIFGGLRDIDMAFRTSPTIPPHGFVWKQDTPNSNRSSGFSHMLSYFRRACRALLMCLQARKTAERLASDFDNKLRQFRDGRKAPPFWNPVAIFSLELASCLCQYGILQAVPMLNEKVSPFALIYIYK